MKFFLDTEFFERPCQIDLISIGLVADNGDEYYAESSEFDWDDASDWLKRNVQPRLSGPLKTRRQIAADVISFVREHCGDEKPEFWGYYADYDWVVFCWLFGSMIDLPQGFPMFCRDLKQWAVMLGDPKLPSQTDEHHALCDARWNKKAWSFLELTSRKL